MGLNIGLMRDRITVLKLKEERDDLGSIMQTVVSVGTYYCKAENVTNKIVGDTLRQSQNTLKLVTRYKKSLETPDNTMFIRFRGADYDIESVINPRMLNESLIIECVLKGE